MYRSLLRKAELPCIPYVLLAVAEIRAVAVQLPDTIESMYNIDKRRRIYKIMDGVLQYQKRPYNLQPVHQIQLLLDDPRAIRGDAELADLSQRHAHAAGGAFGVSALGDRPGGSPS